MSDRTQIWNCGGGTQSAAIAALILAGDLSPPDLAVIVDTERERSSTWRYVDQWIAPALRNLGITLHRVANGLVPKPTTIIQGGSFGADACGSEWAYKRDVPDRQFPADWKQHGRAAGPIRNQQMLDEGQPHLVVAFPGGAGTADMVRRARAAGVPVIEVR